jgi:predicted metal-binding membrane protein
MLSIFSTSKAWALVAIVLVSMIVLAFVECQWHTVTHDQRQDSPAGHQRAPASQTTLDLLCVVAALPLAVSLAPFPLVMSYAMVLVWHPNAFAEPPFIPPEDLL